MSRADWPIEERFCHERAVLGERAARAVARDARAHDKKITAYRCPFTQGIESHWHVGPPPSRADLEAIARRIRERTGNAPGAPTRKATP